ncbi:hypothetical protein LLG46_00370 [bacterium]|nr:hypothetical protein [bacterium]
MPEWTLVAIAICQIITTALVLLTAAALVVGIILIRNAINRKVDEAMAKVQPIINQAKAVSEQVRETVDEVSAKVDSIMASVQSTTGEVTSKIDSIVARVDDTVGSVTGQVNSTVGSIMNKAESTVDQVSGSVTGVTKKVEDAVSPQIANAANIVGTAARCYEIFRDITKSRRTKQSEPNGKEKDNLDG